MATKEREGAILEYRRGRGEVGIGELCRVLYVSEPTMRRDIARLAAEGKLHRTYGGAAARREPGVNLPQALREREHSDAKAAIGERCPARQKELDDLEKRLRGVEAMQNKAIGVWSIISVVLGSLGALLTSLIKKGLAQ
jgi:hypothetical protein